MEALFGITGKDFVLTAADNTVARSIVIMKQGEDKTRDLSKNVVMLMAGEAGDTVHFAEYIQCNVRLHEMQNNKALSTHAVANFTRRELADSLRSRHPYHVNALIAGTDPVTGETDLFWMDYLGALVKLDFAAQGYAAYFCMSLMDRYWRPDLSLEEAKSLMRKCIQELKMRFIAQMPEFTVKLVEKSGISLVTL